ncbi:SUN domain-containing ossification factor isoform X4, partial [Paramuricea clavata]
MARGILLSVLWVTLLLCRFVQLRPITLDSDGKKVDNFGNTAEDDTEKMFENLDRDESVDSGDGRKVQNVKNNKKIPHGVTSTNNRNTGEPMLTNNEYIIPEEPTEVDEEGTPEDMPSFNEWKRKKFAQEEEKKVPQINEKVYEHMIDHKLINHASVDCGANIQEKNQEARNANSILLENKDAYMLNPCSANVWVIVELCDHVQVISLQLANFEMFSSTIEKFQVSFSTRYPTREWSPVQEFVAKPEKTIQTFTIDPTFAKYIKVEQLSHHGSEHYCPWSLLRVYGNSMVAEYEEHESSQDGNPSGIHEDLNTSSNTTEDKQIPQGILKSVIDAVLNFVKELVKKLIVDTEDGTNSTSNIANTTKYPEDNYIQPPLPIVQLTPRDDYEASYHGNKLDNDETSNTCLSGSECDSTESIPNSHQAFLEIVHNICSRRLKCAEAFYANFSKISAANTTNEEENLSKNTKERSLNQDLEKADSQILPEEGYPKENVRVSDSTVSDVIEKQNTRKPENSTNSSQTMPPETNSASKPVYTDISAIAGNPFTPIVLPSSKTSNRLESSSVSGVTKSIDEYDFDRAAAPTHSAQPPLAVNDKPNLVEQPTYQYQASSDTKSTPSENVGFSRASEGLPKVSDSPTSTLDHGTIPSSSIITEAVNGDTIVHERLPGNNKEYERDFKGSPRSNKDHEDVPNPHVDVLKMTLTDAETKEGTAEPEQANEDLACDSNSSIKEEETPENMCSIKQDSSGQCKMKNVTNSKMPEKAKSSNNDPGPVKPVPTHGNAMSNVKKESPLVTLGKKIKVLEQNDYMMKLFLEELSERYRASMNDVKRKMKRKMEAMEMKILKLSKENKSLRRMYYSLESTILTLTNRIEQLEENETTSRLIVANQQQLKRIYSNYSQNFSQFCLSCMMYSECNIKINAQHNKY